MRKNHLAHTVSAVMTDKVVTVELDDTLEKVRQIFQHVHFHHLLVVHNRKLVGVVSDRDLLKEISPFFDTPSEQTRDFAHLRKSVHTIMSRDLVTIEKTASLHSAVQLLLQEGVSCLPVTLADGKVEGILSWKDILFSLIEELGIKEKIRKKRRKKL